MLLYREKNKKHSNHWSSNLFFFLTSSSSPSTKMSLQWIKCVPDLVRLPLLSDLWLSPPPYRHCAQMPDYDLHCTPPPTHSEPSPAPTPRPPGAGGVVVTACLFCVMHAPIRPICAAGRVTAVRYGVLCSTPHIGFLQRVKLEIFDQRHPPLQKIVASWIF